MFKKAVASVFLTLSLVSVGLLPVIASAQNYDPGTGSGSIVPACTGAALSQGSSERECTFCDLVALLQNVMNFIITLVVITAAAMFAWAGWDFATDGGSGQNRNKAKNKIKWAIIGIVLVLGAYTIVDTIMKTLAGGNLTTPWNELCPGTGAELKGTGSSY